MRRNSSACACRAGAGHPRVRGGQRGQGSSGERMRRASCFVLSGFANYGSAGKSARSISPCPTGVGVLGVAALDVGLLWCSTKRCHIVGAGGNGDLGTTRAFARDANVAVRLPLTKHKYFANAQAPFQAAWHRCGGVVRRRIRYGMVLIECSVGCCALRVREH